MIAGIVKARAVLVRDAFSVTEQWPTRREPRTQKPILQFRQGMTKMFIAPAA